MEALQKRKPVTSKKLIDLDNAAEQGLSSHRGIAQCSAARLPSTSVPATGTLASLTSPNGHPPANPSHSWPQPLTSQSGTKQSAEVAFAESGSVTAADGPGGGGGKDMAQGTLKSNASIGCSSQARG